MMDIGSGDAITLSNGKKLAILNLIKRPGCRYCLAATIVEPVEFSIIQLIGDDNSDSKVIVRDYNGDDYNEIFAELIRLEDYLKEHYSEFLPPSIKDIFKKNSA